MPRTERAGGLDPRLAAVRDAQKARPPVRRRPREEPSIDLALVAAREATKAREQALKGRSWRLPPPL